MILKSEILERKISRGRCVGRPREVRGRLRISQKYASQLRFFSTLFYLIFLLPKNLTATVLLLETHLREFLLEIPQLFRGDVRF